MTETLITFETAKLAKEKGFNQLNQGLYYTDDKNHCLVGWGFNDRTETSFAKYSAPTQSELQKWLREKHTIIVLVGLKESSLSLYTPTIQYIASTTTSLIAHFPTHFKTYEQALELGLLEGLKRIK